MQEDHDSEDEDEEDDGEECFARGCQGRLHDVRSGSCLWLTSKESKESKESNENAEDQGVPTAATGEQANALGQAPNLMGTSTNLTRHLGCGFSFGAGGSPAEEGKRQSEQTFTDSWTQYDAVCANCLRLHCNDLALPRFRPKLLLSNRRSARQS